ncbi:MAG: FtsX-like permease family protein, partial [Alphaproteobacteria bacterium]|nr:FtsX-like permease family protein [Alphaproteobacteria bacterium]
MLFLKKIFLPLIYARRDMRAGLKGFYIFLACLVLGVGAIASIQSLSRGLVESLHHDGRFILGGDIALRTVYTPAPPEQVRYLHDHVGPMTTVIETRSMARTTDGKRSTLVNLKAVGVFYPLYGALKIVDEKGDIIKTRSMQDLILQNVVGGRENGIWGALVDSGVLARLHLHLGDWITVGKQRFQIHGIIAREPDRAADVSLAIAPSMIISDAAFPSTGLDTLGSQVYYDYKVIVPGIRTFADVRKVEKKIENRFPHAAWQGRDFLTAAPRLNHLVDILTLFLTLIGLTTLLVGGVGISNAVRSFLETKLPNIATMKCLGAPDKFVFRVYTLQVFFLATFGIALGLGAGVFVSKLAGSFLTAKLNLTDQVQIYPAALLLAAAFGYLTTFCFSLWPVGRAVRVAPTDLFRDLVAPKDQRPALNVILWTVIAAQALALLTIGTSSDPHLVVWFVAGAIATFALFYGYAALMKGAAKRVHVPAAPELRMALANLHRPGNISSSVILSLGLGLTVLVAVALVRFNFIRLITDDISASAPTFFFLDVQQDQRAAFAKMVESFPTAHDLKMLPSFRGRVIAVNGVAAAKALKDQNDAWVINSDRGFSYTSALPAHSQVVKGKWWPADYKGPPLVSISTEVAQAFDIGVGDKITVNIFGEDMTATVANVRKIDWASFTMNFAITFAPGVLESAPATYLSTVIVAKGKA